MKKSGYKIIKNRISKKSNIYLFKTLLNLLKFYSPDDFSDQKFYSKNKKSSYWYNQDFNNKLISLRKNNKKIFSSVYDSLSKSNALVDFCYMNKLDKIASDILNVPSNSLSVRTFTLRMDVPSDKRNTYGWHQDSSYDMYNISGVNGVVLWIPLISVNKKNGSLIIKPGSQNNSVNASYKKLGGKKMVSKQILVKKNLLKKYTSKQVLMNENSVLANYSGLFHKSGHNYSKKVRFVYIVRFNKIISKDFIHFRELN